MSNGTTAFRPPEWLVRNAFELRRELIDVLGMDANATRSEIVAKVRDHKAALDDVVKVISEPPDAFRIKAAEICQGSTALGCGTCKETLNNGCGCHLEWEEMTVLEVEDDEDGDFGDEDQVRVCECGLAWIARYCDDCRAENNQLQKAEDAYHAAAEDAVGGAVLMMASSQRVHRTRDRSAPGNGRGEGALTGTHLPSDPANGGRWSAGASPQPATTITPARRCQTTIHAESRLSDGAGCREMGTRRRPPAAGTVGGPDTSTSL